MKRFDYNQALEFIHGTNWRGSKLGLERTKQLLSLLGNPQSKLTFIHIAGTNGKGSLSAMLSSVLTRAGYKTGLYTSPYILRFNERIRINQTPISDNALADLISDISGLAESMEDRPTEFEIVTAAALLHFFCSGCDYVVLETGLGGELDSTNIIDTPMLAIITTIGFDHTVELGNTMSEIAKAKAGIIKNRGTVLFYGENDEAEDVILKKCTKEKAKLIIPDFTKLTDMSLNLSGITFTFGEYREVFIPLLGTYQYKNAALALSAIDVLLQKGVQISRESIYEGMRTVKWQGRFELLSRAPIFISDGGHNPQGISAAMESYKAHFVNKKAIFLVGMMSDKDIDSAVQFLAPHSTEFIAVAPDNPRSMAPALLAERIKKLGIPTTYKNSVSDGVKEAIKRAGAEGIVFSIGSLYLYREVVSALKFYSRDRTLLPLCADDLTDKPTLYKNKD